MLEVILSVLPQQAIAPDKVIPISPNRVEQAAPKKTASRSAKPASVTSKTGSLKHLAQAITQSVAPASTTSDAAVKTPRPSAPETTQSNRKSSSQVLPEWAIVRTEIRATSTSESPVVPRSSLPPTAEAVSASTCQATAPDSEIKPDTTCNQDLDTAKQERLKLLEQKLAEIVAREKPLKEERQRQNLKAAALRQAEAGKLAEARRTATDLVLSQTDQQDLLKQIQAIATDRAKLVAKQINPGNRLSVVNPRSGRHPLPQLAGISPSGFGSNLRLWKGQWRLGNGNLRLIFPLPIPAPFTSGFGWRIHPVSGESRFHRGIDLGAPIGTPVVATFSGTVTLADYAGGYGLTVILSHNRDTQQTLYAHLSEIFVRPGDRVEQGMVIGRVGNTGLSTGPHLHFEFHQWTTAGWEVLDPAAQLEIALAQLTNGFLVSQNIEQAESLSDDFAAIPPPPTMKRAIVHNF